MILDVHGYKGGELLDREALAAGRAPELQQAFETLLRCEVLEQVVRDLSIDEAPPVFRRASAPLVWAGGQVRVFLLEEFGTGRVGVWLERIFFGHPSTLLSAWTFVDDPDEARRILFEWLEIGEPGKTYGSEVHVAPIFAGPLRPMEVTL